MKEQNKRSTKNNRGNKVLSKKIIIAMMTVVGASLFFFGIIQSDASQANPKFSTDDITQLVSNQYPGTITEMELEKEFNNIIYEVEVISNGKEYDLKIDGNTGEVLKLKEKSIPSKEKVVLDDDNDDINNTNVKEQKTDVVNDNDNKGTVNKEKNIDAQKAIDIALNEFPGTVTDVELDEDDGRLIYEIEIKAGKEEAEIEIDAYTGEVLVIEIDN